MSKYNSNKVTYKGIKFDSASELDRYIELLDKQDKGEISYLERQVPFVLIPAQYEHVTSRKKKKCIERECKYVCDFMYTENNVHVVEDVKGNRTPDYKIKRKLMLYNYGIQIREIPVVKRDISFYLGHYVEVILKQDDTIHNGWLSQQDKDMVLKSDDETLTFKKSHIKKIRILYDIDREVE